MSTKSALPESMWNREGGTGSKVAAQFDDADFDRVSREMLDGDRIVALNGGSGSRGGTKSRNTPVFDMSSAGQSFNDASAPASSVLGTPQRYVVADNSMRMVPNMEYVGPNGEANIVSAYGPASADSNFFGYTKQAILDKTMAAAVWGVQQHDLLGDAVMYSASAAGALTDVFYPGSLQQAGFAVGGGAVIGKVAPMAMGYLNSLPYLGETVPRIAERVFGAEVNSTFTAASRSGLDFESTITRQTDRLTTYDLSTNQRILQDGSITSRSYQTSFISTTFDESAGHLFIDKMGAQSGHYLGREMLSNVIESIGPQNIKSIGAEFADTNLGAFKGMMSEGMTAEHAARNTPLGKALRDLGYGPYFNSVVPTAYPRPTVNYVIKSK